MASTTGISIGLESYADNDDINDNQEYMTIGVGFLDRNMDKAFECLSELLATPNFNDPTYIQDLFRQFNLKKT